MIYRLADIMRNVRVALDLNNSSAPLVLEGDVDTLTLDEIIASKVEEGARRVAMVAPVHLLEEGHQFGDAVYWNPGRTDGWVLLPDDFMRLVAFRMSDWERTVYAAISADDPQYLLQSSRFSGLRGGVQRPVCAIVNRAEGKALEFYSCRSTNAYVNRASYLPYPRIDADGGIDISERCYSAVVYQTAALVSTTCGDTARASALADLAQSNLQ